MRRRATGRDKFERIAVGRPGDEVLRRRVRRHAQLRFRPGIPGAAQFIKIMLTETPLVPMVIIVAVILAGVAGLLAFVERAAYHLQEPNASGYVDWLWWTISSMTTQGTPWRPETAWGKGVGAAWAILGVGLFWGTIVASVTVYFSRRRERTEREIIGTIKRNLDDLDELTLQELELLEESASNVINLQIEQVKARSAHRPPGGSGGERGRHQIEA